MGCLRLNILEQDYKPSALQINSGLEALTQEKTTNFLCRAYLFGFGGQMRDDEIAGDGNNYTAEFWQYDSRLGRRWNVDPLFDKYPHQSPYSTYNNNPLYWNDPNGKGGVPHIMQNSKGDYYIVITSTVYLYTDDPNIDMNKFRDKYSNEVNKRLNPNGTDVEDNLNLLPTVKFKVPAAFASSLGVNPGQTVRLPVINVVNVVVIEGGPEAAVKKANGNTSKAVNFYYVYSGDKFSEDQNSARGGNSGYINANSLPAVWAHERLHDLGWSVNPGEETGHTETDLNSIMCFPYNMSNPVRQDDFNKINHHYPLKQNVSFGEGLGNKIYNKNSQSSSNPNKWTPIN